MKNEYPMLQEKYLNHNITSHISPNTLVIASDGGCRNNQKISKNSKSACAFRLEDNKHHLFGGKFNYGKTNNYQELQGLVSALQKLTPTGIHNYHIIVDCDSKYIDNAINKHWINKWAKNNFKKRPNKEFWKIVYKYYQQCNMTFKWVKGHHKNTNNWYRLNNFCDQYLNQLMDKNK